MPVLPTDRAHELREYGLNTARQLHLAAQQLEPAQHREVTALAARLLHCNNPKNTWIGRNLVNPETGETFDGFGRYWHCGSKLCSYCLRANARRNRNTIRRAFAEQRLLVGQHYRLITFTVPNLSLDLPTSRAIVDRAWTLLRKRSFFIRSVVGGGKAEEFTYTRRGYHYHIHVLAITRTMTAKKLRSEWTQCYFNALPAHIPPPTINTPDGLLNVNIKIVHDLRKVANELCKYVTKANSWLKIPLHELAQIALIRNFNRMFEVFGSFRNLPKFERPKPLRDLNDGFDQNPDQQPSMLPDDHGVYWRDLVHRMPLDAYLRRLEGEVASTIELRTRAVQLKFPFATFTTLDSS